MNTITYGVCRENLGEITSAQYRAYKSEVRAALESAFPDEEIIVQDSTFANASTCAIGHTRADITRDDVEEAINDISEDWWEAE